MSNNKQSSIDWLIDTMHRSAGLDQHQIDLIIEQAKAMHKEEVLSFNTLLDKHEIEALNNNTILLTKEEFYNETFGE